MHFASPYYLWLLSALVPMIAYYVWRTVFGARTTPSTLEIWIDAPPCSVRHT